MSGRGETPEEESEDTESELLDVDIGETLYTGEGTPVGTVRGVQESGIFVTVRDGAEALSAEHARSGHAFGEAELMWRCMNCGEMGEIDEGLPDDCPNCGTGREELMYWTED
jgi:rubrerythrin